MNVLQDMLSRQTAARRLAFAAGAAIVGFAAPAQAAVITTGCGGGTACTLQQLFDGGSISVNDTDFNAWELDLADALVNPNNIVVSGIDEVSIGVDKATLGLRFSFDPALSLSGAQAVEFDWDFTASSVRMFTELALTLVGFSVGPNGSFVEINSNSAGTTPNNISVDQNTTANSGTIAGLNSLVLDPDIQSEADGGSASLTQFDFLFTVMGDQPPPVNTPATALLLVSGLAGLALFRRRKKSPA